MIKRTLQKNVMEKLLCSIRKGEKTRTKNISKVKGHEIEITRLLAEERKSYVKLRILSEGREQTLKYMRFKPINEL
jgi:hypothetical protein